MVHLFVFFKSLQGCRWHLYCCRCVCDGDKCGLMLQQRNVQGKNKPCCYLYLSDLQCNSLQDIHGRSSLITALLLAQVSFYNTGALKIQKKQQNFISVSLASAACYVKQWEVSIHHFWIIQETEMLYDCCNLYPTADCLLHRGTVIKAKRLKLRLQCTCDDFISDIFNILFDGIQTTGCGLCILIQTCEFLKQ